MSETLSRSFVVKRGGNLVFLIFALEFLLANALIFSHRCQNEEATNIDYAKIYLGQKTAMLPTKGRKRRMTQSPSANRASSLRVGRGGWSEVQIYACEVE